MAHNCSSFNGSNPVNSQAYNSWREMRSRCHNECDRDYPNYGGKGIKVFGPWRETGGAGFARFLDSLGLPATGQTIDRYPDRKGNYEPSNCRWASRRDQALNRECTIILTHNGESKPLTIWAESIGIKADTLRHRIHAGWPHDKALTQPVKQQRRSK